MARHCLVFKARYEKNYNLLKYGTALLKNKMS